MNFFTIIIVLYSFKNYFFKLLKKEQLQLATDSSQETVQSMLVQQVQLLVPQLSSLETKFSIPVEVETEVETVEETQETGFLGEIPYKMVL